MNKATQMGVACMLAVILLAVLGEVLYLDFVFPKILAAWTEQGRELTGFQQLQANLSRTCTSLGLALILLLVAGLVACGFWWKVAARKESGRQ